jgi:hypothetical protein
MTPRLVLARNLIFQGVSNNSRFQGNYGRRFFRGRRASIFLCVDVVLIVFPARFWANSVGLVGTGTFSFGSPATAAKDSVDYWSALLEPMCIGEAPTLSKIFLRGALLDGTVETGSAAANPKWS